MGLIKFERTIAPTCSVEFSRNPGYSDIKRQLKYYQPKVFTDGGILFVYSKALLAKNWRTLHFKNNPSLDYSNFLAFLATVKGAVYDFTFTDVDESTSTAVIWNADDFQSGPVFYDREEFTVVLYLKSGAETPEAPGGGGGDVAIMSDTFVTWEDLIAGNFVNIFSDSGVGKVRKSDLTAAGKEMDGFVLADAAAGATVTVYFAGVNDQLSGLTPGADYFGSTTPGAISTTPPSGDGNVVQFAGRAISAFKLNFQRGVPVGKVS